MNLKELLGVDLPIIQTPMAGAHGCAIAIAVPPGCRWVPPICCGRTLHRAALKGEGAHRTALTNLFTGRPARGIVKRFIRECGPMSADAPAFPLASA